MGSNVKAGGAEVDIDLNDKPYDAGLDRAELRLKAFGAAAIAMGARLTGLGVGLGTGLFGAGSSFASIGTKLKDVNAQLATTKVGTPEFAKLTAEAKRLSTILGGESLESSIKLGKSLSALRDSVSGVVVKVGGVLAPAITATAQYFTKAVKSVGDLIEKNRTLAPQAAIVAGALVTVGTVIAGLGAAFYVAGPVIRLAMIGATAATLGFSFAIGITQTTVAVLSTLTKILTGTVVLSAIAFKTLSTLLVFNSVVGGILTTVLKGLLAITLSLTIAAAVQVTIWATMRAGLFGVCGAVQAVTNVMRLCTIASIAWQIAMALFWVGLAGLILTAGTVVAQFAIGITVLAARFTGLDTVASGAFNSIRDTAVSVFGGILESGEKVPGVLSGHFATVAEMARTMFGNVSVVAKGALSSSIVFFKDLLGTATSTFKGISDAISAGNIQLAMDVLWAGLKISWVKGTDGLKNAFGASMVYVEAILDDAGTSIKLVWDVLMIYLEGCFDKFCTYIQDAITGAVGFIGEKLAMLDPTGLLADDEAIKQSNVDSAQKSADSAAQRASERDARLANTGDDAGQAKRAAARQVRLDATNASSPELERLESELALLVAQAAEQSKNVLSPDKAQQGADAVKQASIAGGSVGASARGSSEAASSIAKAFNNGSRTPEVQTLAAVLASNKLLEKQNKLMADLIKKPSANFVEVS
jgi:hypothetical protein